MVKVTLNGIINTATGRMGDVVFRVTESGTSYVTRVPDMSGVVWSEAQLAHRERFREAVAYAKEALADPKVRARYEEAAKKAQKRAYDLAISDYFKGKQLLTGGSRNKSSSSS